MAPPARLVRWLAASLAITPSLALTPVHIALQHARSLQAAGEPITAYAAQRPAYNLSVPIDHFHNDSLYEPHSDGFFDLRYWVDESHYRPGGPVIVLAAGEIDADERLPYLDHGIVAMLARATGGVGVVLEHRYYGTSFPFQNVTVDSLRFLSTDQALADTAYFAKHVKFPRHGGLNAPDTPYIIYGGSYAGAFAAFARKLYPDVFWGAISSSGVTAAVFDYWEYFEAARLFAPGECGPKHQNIFKIIDNVLLGGDRDKVRALKNVFGLGDLEEDKDFAETLSTPIYGLQSTNWDPELDDYEWGHYCGAITSGALLYGSTRHLLPTVKKLVAEAGFDDDDEIVYNLLNFIGFSKGTIVRTLKGPCKGLSAQKCFSREEQLNDIAQHGLIPTWVISWFYQTCTQWGYFVTGTGVPQDQLPLVSRVIDLAYAHAHCPILFNITPKASIVDSVNRLGGFDFSYPRVAIVDGSRDPWRQATPHRLGLPERNSSVEEPFILLDYGVHHWDENGLPGESGEPDLPPFEVLETQREEVDFVKAWLQEFEVERRQRQVDDGPSDL
ncbi:hypothetical protein S40293_04720 [Stachybotrys chartarum IBT 40293]|nr:hypothetical protein S40293_04720 [Stachybotrys chartarum IBT 40293]